MVSIVFKSLGGYGGTAGPPTIGNTLIAFSIVEKYVVAARRHTPVH